MKPETKSAANKFPRKISARLYSLMEMGIKSFGTYDPDKIVCMFEEYLTGPELKQVESFLTWVNASESTRYFGHGNYQARYQEFLNDQK